MRLAVVLATHQGERHLDAQLRSLVDQDRRPDLLVVHDDASTDRTVEVLERFAADAPLRVVLHVGPQRLGPRGAFEAALTAARAIGDVDVVALCDQDDVWAPDKLRRIEAALVAEPAARQVWSDAALIDERGRPLGLRRWSLAGFDHRRRQAVRRDPLGVLADRYLVPGCTLAFRAADLEVVLPFPPELDADPVQLLHDVWIATALAALGPVALIDDALVDQRVHDAQAVGVRAARWRRMLPTRLRWAVDGVRTRSDPVHRRARAALLEAARRSVGAATVAGADQAAVDLATASALLARRAAIGGTRRSRVRPVLAALRAGDYRRFAAGWASAAFDVLRRPAPGAPRR